MPLDALGDQRLPPDAQAASDAAWLALPEEERPSGELKNTAWALGNQKGHWCFNVVCTENKTIRERGKPALRGQFLPGPSSANNLAPREPREARNLRIEDIDFDNSSLPLTLACSPEAKSSEAGPSDARGQEMQTGTRTRSRGALSK